MRFNFFSNFIALQFLTGFSFHFVLISEESSVKASATKKQKAQQRPRKEKPQQHTFSHPLLASSLKVQNCFCWFSQCSAFHTVCLVFVLQEIIPSSVSLCVISLGVCVCVCSVYVVRVTVVQWRVWTSAVMVNTWPPALTIAPSASGALKTSWWEIINVWGLMWSTTTPRSSASAPTPGETHTQL